MDCYLGRFADIQVPYIGLRSFCAIMGSITIPIVYAIMRESGYPVAISAFTAALILFGKLLHPSLSRT